MAFSVSTRTQSGVSKLDPTIYVLQDDGGGQAEVWPALGFNCFSWQAVLGKRSFDLLYADPNLFGDGRPTRSGIPILFPFPNRIRDGRFKWADKEYHIPPNDGPLKNAIHGFACRRPWRVIGQGADADSAFVTGAFRGSVDARDCVDLWPADYELRVTYRLRGRSLSIEATAINPDTKALPWGLGYHPYFKLPFTSVGTADDCLLRVPAKSFWELQDCLSTGKILPVDAVRGLNSPRRYADVHVDDVLTGLEAPGADGMRLMGAIEGANKASLLVYGSPDFRETVVFTPANRQAFCIEPYTCTTDAVNLEARGVSAGWRTLSPGDRWIGLVELHLA
jgi:aldose 1-epimerase